MEKVMMAVTVVPMSATELETLFTEKLTNKANGAEILSGLPATFRGVVKFTRVEGVTIDGTTNNGDVLTQVKSLAIVVQTQEGVFHKVSVGNLPKNVCQFILDNKAAFLAGTLTGYTMQVGATEVAEYNGSKFTRITLATVVAGRPQFVRPDSVPESMWNTLTEAQKQAMAQTA